MRLEWPHWHEWRNAAVKPHLLAELKTPAEFDAASRGVTLEETDNFIPLITRGTELFDLVEECASCGFEEVYIHNVSRDQHGFIVSWQSRYSAGRRYAAANASSRNQPHRLEKLVFN